jgi:sulfofructose kinase
LSKIFDCLGFGIAPADILMEIEKFPKAGVKIDATDLTIQGGGPIPTAMVTMARMGKKVALLAAVGDDLFGRFVIEQLKTEKVDTSQIIIRKNRSTAIASGWYEPGSGRRTIVLDLKIDIKPHEINLNKLPPVQIVHLDGRYLPACIKLVRWVKRAGALSVLDVGSVRNDVTELLPQVDHLVCAQEFARHFTKSKTIREAVAKLAKICPGTVVVTDGIKGSIGREPNKDFISQPAYKVKTVDSTGAGDVYHGAYIVGLLNGYSLASRMKLASAAAAIKCTKPGGRIGIPTMPEVQKFLKKKGDSLA